MLGVCKRQRGRERENVHSCILTRCLRDASVNTLFLELRDGSAETGNFAGEAFTFHFEVGGLFCNFEFLGIEAQDGGGVGGGVVLGEGVRVVCGEGVVGAGEVGEG